MSTLNPKSVFYLRHKEQIHSWVSLGAVAADEVHRWLSGWGEPMQELRSDADVLLWDALENTGTPKLLWHKEEWKTGPEVQRPAVGVGFEWSRAQPLRRDGLFCGIWVDRGRKGDPYKGLKERLDLLVDDTRGLQRDRRTKWWPLIQRLPPIAEVVQEAVRRNEECARDTSLLEDPLSEYQSRCLETVDTIWVRLSEKIDEVVAGGLSARRG